MNNPVHYDWLADLRRGYAVAQSNSADVQTMPATIALAGQLSNRLFEDSAAAMLTGHPRIAHQLSTIGVRLQDTISAATTAPAQTMRPAAGTFLGMQVMTQPVAEAVEAAPGRPAKVRTGAPKPESYNPKG
jgi:hypothetical protein